jgi:sensor histidine kinase YesM
MRVNKKITIFITVVISCATFAMIYQWLETGNPFQSSTIGLGTIFLLMTLIGLSFGHAFFQKILNRPVKQVKKIILPAFICFLLVILLISLFVISMVSYVSHLIMGLDTGNVLNHLLQKEFPGAIKFYLITIFIASAFFFYIIWRQAIDREQKLREENLKYKYINLKTQVNPHFLFNSLNTLSELVYEDPKKADKYIQKLAGIYRYILDHEEIDLIPLDKEIAFVKQYFDLQKERSGNRIQLDITIKNAEKYRIIPVSLQMLIENALKHNSMSDECPLKIHIENDKGYVTVSNDIQRKDIINQTSGTGLSNLKERVNLITGKTIIIDQKNNIFTVKLPIIESE